jgi:hypothetical protein
MTGRLKVSSRNHTYTLLCITISLRTSLLLRSIWINSWVVNDRVFRFLWTWKLNISNKFVAYNYKNSEKGLFFISFAFHHHYNISHFQKAFFAWTAWHNIELTSTSFIFSFIPILNHFFRFWLILYDKTYVQLKITFEYEISLSEVLNTHVYFCH